MPQKGSVMNYEDFKARITENVRGRLGQEYSVRVFRVKKNNGLVLDNLSILGKGESISPCIYLEYYFQKVQQGMDEDEAASQIIAYYYAALPEHFHPENYFSEQSVKSHVVCRLVNTKRNQEFLKESPHRSFLNLSIVFYLLFEDAEIGAGTIALRYEHLEGFHLHEEELLPLALKNTKRLLPADFMTMTDLIEELRTGKPYGGKKEDEGEEKVPADDAEEDGMPLYVLTNSRRTFGAVWIADPETLAGIAGKLGDDFYVLPSSVHECMILPARLRDDAKSLQSMVEEINATQVSPDEVLADNVYRYSRKAGKLEIAA